MTIINNNINYVYKFVFIETRNYPEAVTITTENVPFITGKIKFSKKQSIIF